MDLTLIQPFLNWIEHNPGLAGVVIFLMAASESLAVVGILIPGIVFMLGVGTLVGLNALGLWSTLFWAALGAITGDWVSYWLGRHFDRQLRHVWPLSRYPALIPKGERFFQRHGGQSIFFGRFVGPLRPIIPAVAGIMHMPQGKFYAINVISALLWAPMVILPGVAFGESLQLAGDVVWRLLTVIALVVVISGLLGYLTKALFSYALATRVDTWLDYYKMRGARENVVSLGLMAALVLSTAWFVNNYDIRYQPLMTKAQATDYQWWQNNWQSFFLVHTRYDNEHPVSLQWWGRLDDIKQAVTSAGWQSAVRVTPKSSLNYFLPNAPFNKIPVMADQLFNQKEVLLLVAPDKASNSFFVFRLWSANPAVNRAVPQLWLGSVHSVRVFSPFNMINLPIPLQDYSRALTRFKRSLDQSRQPVSSRKVFYQQLGISASWKGEVLLLQFDDDRTGEAVDRTVTMASYILGRSGMSLRAPGPFTVEYEKSAQKGDGPLQQGAYVYRQHGVNITVNYRYTGKTITPLSQWRRQLEARLRNVQGLQLRDLSVNRISKDKARGFEYLVHYDMPPFGKGFIYRIHALRDSSARWLINASYKDCDPRGEAIVKALLDSVVLPTLQ